MLHLNWATDALARSPVSPVSTSSRPRRAASARLRNSHVIRRPARRASAHLGRLCSLCLRLPDGMDPPARRRAIVDQLGGIGGTGSVGFGPGRLRSLPAAVARVLATRA